MTGEQFHDALTLLPADLIAQADEFRCRKRKILPWKRYTAMAASLGMLLCAAALYQNSRQNAEKTEMAAAPFAAMREETADSGAPRMEAAKGTVSNALADRAVPFLLVETPELPNTASFDRSSQIITSAAQLQEYFARRDAFFGLDSLREACLSFGEDWFAENDLLLILAGGISPEQPSVDVAFEDGCCRVSITPSEENAGFFHILIPTEKGIISDRANIIITYHSDTNP